MQTRFNTLTCVALFVVLALASVLAFLSVMQRRAQRLVPQRLVALAGSRGIVLELGTVSSGLFGVSVEDSRFMLRGDELLRGEISRIEVDGGLIGAARATFQAVKAHAKGEPSKLFDLARAILGQESDSFVRFSDVDLDYEHPVVGRVSWKDLSVETVSPELVFRAPVVEFAGEAFADVELSATRRGDFLEIGVGAASTKDAKLKIAQYAPSAGGSEWVLNVAYQPLSDLLARLGWATGPELRATAVVGTITLGVGANDRRPRGQMRLTLDRWPKPDWPEADKLLGRSAALFAMMEAEDAPTRLALPYVEITLPLFRLTGPGRLDLLGPRRELRFDVKGQEICRVLAARVAPSAYRNALAAFMDSHPALASVSSEESPFAQLRVQLDAAAAPARAALAMELGAGCGLDAQVALTFASLSLPAFRPPTPVGSSAGTSAPTGATAHPSP